MDNVYEYSYYEVEGFYEHDGQRRGLEGVFEVNNADGIFVGQLRDMPDANPNILRAWGEFAIGSINNKKTAVRIECSTPKENPFDLEYSLASEAEGKGLSGKYVGKCRFLDKERYFKEMWMRFFHFPPPFTGKPDRIVPNEEWHAELTLKL
jgi:hypothetical protein